MRVSHSNIAVQLCASADSLRGAQVDEVTLRRVVDDWAGAVLRLVTLMPAHPAVQRDLPGMCAPSQPCPCLPQRGNDYRTQWRTA